MEKDIFPEKKITRTLISEILKHYFDDFRLMGFRVIKFGIENQTIVASVDKQKYAIRIYNRFQYGLFKRLETHILWEIDLMNYLRGKGIPIPRILSTSDNKQLISINLGKKKYFVVLSEFIGGRHVKRFNSRKLREAIKLQAVLHKFAKNFTTSHRRANTLQYGFEEYVLRNRDKKIAKNKKHEQLLIELWKVINDLYPQLKKLLIGRDKIAIHDDLNRENFKFVGDRIVGIFDFDDCLLGYPMGELGKTIHFLIDKTKSPKLIDSQIKKAIAYYSKNSVLNKTDMQIVRQSFLVSWASRQFAGFDGKATEIRKAKHCIKYFEFYINGS